MVSKAELVQQRLTEINEKFGPVAGAVAVAKKTDHGLPAALYHGRIETVERAAQVGNYMAEYGNHPSGMSPCEVAGINGDAEHGCPFIGEPFCECDTDTDTAEEA